MSIANLCVCPALNGVFTQANFEPLVPLVGAAMERDADYRVAAHSFVFLSQLSQDSKHHVSWCLLSSRGCRPGSITLLALPCLFQASMASLVPCALKLLQRYLTVNYVALRGFTFLDTLGRCCPTTAVRLPVGRV